MVINTLGKNVRKNDKECWKIGWSGIFPIKNDIQAGSREPGGDQDRGN